MFRFKKSYIQGFYHTTLLHLEPKSREFTMAQAYSPTPSISSQKVYPTKQIWIQIIFPPQNKKRLKKKIRFELNGSKLLSLWKENTHNLKKSWCNFNKIVSEKIRQVQSIETNTIFQKTKHPWLTQHSQFQAITHFPGNNMWVSSIFP